MTDDNRWDDLLNAAIKKNKPKANEPVYDPGLLPPPHLDADRIPDSLDYHQLRCEFRNYVKATSTEIEELKTVNADLCSEIYRTNQENIEIKKLLFFQSGLLEAQDKSIHTCMTKIGDLYDHINNLEPVPATPWYRDERNIALAAVLLVLVVMWLVGGR